jgi:hypothetical protein
MTGRRGAAQELAHRVRRGASRRIRRRLGLPPARPRGWVLGPPDFVGVGTQKSGTSWWYWLVCDHPQVTVGFGKELHFFDPYVRREFGEDDVSR